MKWILENSNEIYELPKNYKITLSSLRKRIRPVDIYQGDGSVATGDRRVGGRTARISFNATSNSENNPEINRDQIYLDELTKLYTFFEPIFQPVYLIRELDDGSRRRVQVDLTEQSDDPISPGTDLRIGNNFAQLEMYSPFFEDYIETIIDDLGVITNEDIVEIENDSLLIAYPVLEIIALNQVTEFTIANQNTGQVFAFSNPTFGSGATLVIDPRNEGKVELNGVNTYNSLVDGSGFLFLGSGINPLLFESSLGQVEIVISYRRRFPV